MNEIKDFLNAELTGFSHKVVVWWGDKREKKKKKAVPWGLFESSLDLSVE